MSTEHTWKKARRSENDANCVEVRNTFDRVRDSKNPTGSPLRADVPALLRFVTKN